MLGQKGAFLRVVIPFYPGDIHLLSFLLKRIEQLSSRPDVLFVSPYPCTPGEPLRAMLESKSHSCFRKFDFLTVVPDVSGWPEGPNNMFLAAIKVIHQNKMGPFLFLEPDALPLKNRWFEELEHEYQKAGKPFVGSINTDASGLSHFSGVGMYPEDAYIYWKDFLPSKEAFDMLNQYAILSNAAHTKLIYNLWGQKGLSPTFKENREKKDPINTMTLSQIPRQTVIFHRCKDSSLFNLLTEKGIK